MTNDFTYSVLRKEAEIEAAALVMLKHRMYIPDWSFHEWLKYPYSNIRIMVICQKEAIPIGLGILSKYSSIPQGGIFVRKAYRRLGIGTIILKLLVREKGSPLKIDFGNKGSNRFYEKCQERGINIMLPEDEAEIY